MEQGIFAQQLSWTQRHMTRTAAALASLPDLSGMRLALSLHLDLKMVPLVTGLLDKGAELFVVTCSPATVRDQVASAMQDLGARVEAWQGMPAAAYQSAIDQALAWQPTHLAEMGADLSAALLGNERHGPIRAGIRAGLEATGSGINRLQSLTLPYPVFNWDDLPVKEGLHNRHMVGLTTWQTFFARTQLTLHEKKVVVIGYGSVGQGIAQMARAYGGTVTIVERDPTRQVEAAYDGWLVEPLDAALVSAEVIVTATGAHAVIAAEQFPALKNEVFLLNCGHRDDEIDVSALRGYPATEVLPQIEEFQIGNKRIYLLARGAMFNLTAGEGDSLNAFDLTLAILVAGIGFIAAQGSAWPPGVHLLPQEVWQAII